MLSCLVSAIPRTYLQLMEYFESVRISSGSAGYGHSSTARMMDWYQLCHCATHQKLATVVGLNRSWNTLSYVVFGSFVISPVDSGTRSRPLLPVTQSTPIGIDHESWLLGRRELEPISSERLQI